MGLKKILTVAGVVVGLNSLAVPAQAAEKAECWTGGESPHRSGFSAVGEATFRCTNGEVKPGVPVLSQRIKSMQMEAVLQVQNPATHLWETRATPPAASRDGAGTLRIPLQDGCLAVVGGGSSRIWRVVIIYAVANQSDTSVWEFYGDASPTAELTCT